MSQVSIFDMLREPVSISKPIRLIELFAGYGSQAMALERMGVDFEHYKAVDFDEPAIKSYNAVHGTNFPAIDIKNVTGKSLEIREREILLPYDLQFSLYGYQYRGTAKRI